MNKANLSLDSLAPFFQKLEQLTKLQRILIYVGTILAFLGAFAYFFYFPKHEQINKLDQDLASAVKKLDKAKRNAMQLNKYRNQMKNAQEQFRVVMKALPEKEEIPSLLASISQSGKDAGLDFKSFKPKPEVAKDFYAEIPVNINVSGNYHNVAIFFDKVANLDRIVNIQDINMKPLKGGEIINTTCTAVTYKFIDPKKQKKSKKRKKRKK